MVKNAARQGGENFWEGGRCEKRGEGVFGRKSRGEGVRGESVSRPLNATLASNDIFIVFLMDFQ